MCDHMCVCVCVGAGQAALHTRLNCALPPWHADAAVLACVQVDMLDSQDEVKAVLDFVSSNTSKLLQVGRGSSARGSRAGLG